VLYPPLVSEALDRSHPRGRVPVRRRAWVGETYPGIDGAVPCTGRNRRLEQVTGHKVDKLCRLTHCPDAPTRSRLPRL